MFEGFFVSVVWEYDVIAGFLHKAGIHMCKQEHVSGI